MNDQLLERIAVALEQIALHLIDSPQSGAGVAPPPAPAAAAFAAQQPKPAAVEPSICPVHGTEFRTTKRDGTPAKRAYCSGKLEDGSYCTEKGPWLNG